MMDYALLRKNLELEIKKEFPDFELVDKRKSLLMKALSKVLFFNKAFMSRYITVIGNKVYVPSLPFKEDDPLSACVILAHEWVHMKDAKRWGLLYKFGYLFPQIFAILAPLGLVWPPAWLCALFLLPLPAPVRAELEFRAYAVSMAVRWWTEAQEPNWGFYKRQFNSSAYYWMYPYDRLVEITLKEEFERIKRMDLRPHERQILEILIDG